MTNVRERAEGWLENVFHRQSVNRILRGGERLVPHQRSFFNPNDRREII